MTFHWIAIAWFVYPVTYGEHLGGFRFGLLEIKLLWTFVYKFLYRPILSFLLHTRVIPYGWASMVGICLTLKELSNCAFQSGILFQLSTSNVWLFQLLYILTNTLVWSVYFNFKFCHRWFRLMTKNVEYFIRLLLSVLLL